MANGSPSFLCDNFKITAEDLLHTSVRIPLPCPENVIKRSPDMARDVSVRNQQNCEVLGPDVCQHCLESNSKVASSGHMLGITPNIGSSDLLMTLRLQKCYPLESQVEIKKKIRSGQVVSTAFSSELQRRRETVKELTSLNRPSNKKTLILKNEHRFFINVDDLRRKISSGAIIRPHAAKQKESLMEKLFPAFISPSILLKQSERPKIHSHVSLEPPLLPLLSQNPPNHFFAGQRTEYKLPTPLPENPEYLHAIQGMTKSCDAIRSGLLSGFRGQRSISSRLSSSLLMRRPTSQSISMSSRESTYLLSDTF